MMKRTLWALLLLISTWTVSAQEIGTGDFNLLPGIDYEIGGINVTGARDLDPNVVIITE
jgi:hypothetical protein